VKNYLNKQIIIVICENEHDAKIKLIKLQKHFLQNSKQDYTRFSFIIIIPYKKNNNKITISLKITMVIMSKAFLHFNQEV